MKIHTKRLLPEQDLKKEILQLCEQSNITAGCIISSVGSLQTFSLRLADSNQTLTRDERVEIISLNGTVSKNGLHLHMSIAKANGAVFGGHLLEGNLIYTTCELIVLETNEFNFNRDIDPATTFKELIVTKS